MTVIEPLTFFMLCCASCSVSGNVYRITKKHLLIPLTQILSLSCNRRQSVMQPPTHFLLCHTHIYYYVRTCLGRRREGERASLSPSHSPPPSTIVPSWPTRRQLSPPSAISPLMVAGRLGVKVITGPWIFVPTHFISVRLPTGKSMSVALMKGLHSCPMDPLVFILCPYTVSAMPTPLLLTPPPQILPDILRLMCRTVGGVGAHSRAGKPELWGLFAGRYGTVQ